MFVSLNFLAIIFTKNKFPWSLYVAVIWGSLLMMHFGLLWSIFHLTHAGTEELDALFFKIFSLVGWFFKHVAVIFTKGINPFPENSRVGRIYE